MKMYIDIAEGSIENDLYLVVKNSIGIWRIPSRVYNMNFMETMEYFIDIAETQVERNMILVVIKEKLKDEQKHLDEYRDHWKNDVILRHETIVKQLKELIKEVQ